jgi:hypothetical protein
MMGRQKNSASAWKPVLVITGGCVVLFLVVFGFLYYTNKPNYRDLEKEYSKLSIPSDWKLVGQDFEKGVFGFLCIQVDTACPAIYSQYRDSSSISSNKDLLTINNIFLKSNILIKKRLLDDCKEYRGDKYYCRVEGSHQKIGIIISVGSNSRGEKVWNLSMGQKNAFAIQ